MRTAQQGILIALEGIDGSGKSTLAQNLASSLQQHKYPVLLTKEPGGTQLGQQLRTFLQEKKFPINAKAEFLLFAADRAQHFDELIMPKLAQGYIIISDRMADSSLVYQGYGRNLNRTILRRVNAWVMQERMPDIVLYIDIPFEVAWQRLQQRKQLTSFEQEKAAFTRRVIKGYQQIFKKRSNVIYLDGTLPIDELGKAATAKVLEWIKTHSQQ